MALWADISPTIVAAITAVALEAADVPVSPAPPFEPRWLDQKRPYVDPVIQAEVLLHIPSFRKVGNDGWVDKKVGGNLLRYQEGMREFVLAIQVRSFNQLEPMWAIEYAQRIVTRLDRQSIRDLLLTKQVAIIEYQDVLNVASGVKIDSRIVAVANANVRMRAGFSDTQSTAEVLGWFDKISISSAVAGLPASAQVTDVVIPPGLPV